MAVPLRPILFLATVPQMTYRILILRDFRGKALLAPLAAVLEQTRDAVLMLPGKVHRVTSVETIQKLQKRWPDSQGAPWILAGSRSSSLAPPSRPCALTEDALGRSPEDLVSDLLATWEWVCFQYFATFHASASIFATGNHCFERTFATNHSGGEAWHELPPDRGWTLTTHLSVADDDLPGEYAHELSIFLDQAPPFVLCRQLLPAIDGTSQDRPDLQVDSCFPGCRILLEFRTEPGQDPAANFWVVEPEDHLAHSRLWSAQEGSGPKAHWALSRDTDLSALSRALRNHPRMPLDHPAAELGSWRYGLIHGGGEGEFHGLFKVRHPRTADCLARLAGPALIARF